MRLRQTYQPEKQGSQTERSMRIVHSFGRQPHHVEHPKPINPLTNLRLFLYKTKEKLISKENSQFSRNDPLTKEQPQYQFNQGQNAKKNQIKFQAYLDGELSPQEYLTLRNYERLYTLIRGEKEEIEPVKYKVEKESTWKKLKERIVFKYKKESRRKTLIPSIPYNGADPSIELAQRMRNFIIKQNVNKCVEHLNIEKSMKQIKMIQQADFAVEEIQNNLNINDNYYSNGLGKRPSKMTKNIKIIQNKSVTERSENQSKRALFQSVIEQADQIQSQIQRERTEPDKKTITFQIDFPKKSQRSNYSQRIKQQNSKQLINNQTEIDKYDQQDQSADSSLYSLYEKRIDSLYTQSQLLQNQIKENQCETLIKKIKMAQNLNKVKSEMLRVNNQKLHKVMNL